MANTSIKNIVCATSNTRSWYRFYTNVWDAVTCHTCGLIRTVPPAIGVQFTNNTSGLHFNDKGHHWNSIQSTATLNQLHLSYSCSPKIPGMDEASVAFNFYTRSKLIPGSSSDYLYPIPTNTQCISQSLETNIANEIFHYPVPILTHIPFQVHWRLRLNLLTRGLREPSKLLLTIIFFTSKSYSRL